MSARTSATRYAKALLDVASDQAADIERGLTALNTLVHEHAELRQALQSPSVSATAKRGVVTAVAERLGIATTGVRLLQLLAERDRLGLLDDLLEAYRDLLLDRQQIVKAEVRSATALSPDAMRAVEERLGAITGKRVAVHAVVDPDLLGGVVASVGGTVYDGSVRTQLEKLRKQLVAHA
ncbi:MAG: ATP synthase F1 subunit delta [Vicinamibacterales bacterium]